MLVLQPFTSSTEWPGRPASVPAVSVVIAARDEADCIGKLLGEIVATLETHEDYEIIVVDDGSADGTADAVRAAVTSHGRIALLGHRRSCGQSAAIRTGVEAALGGLIVTLDGDGQNDPADIPTLLALYRAAAASNGVRMVAGQRVRRNDPFARRMASRIANGARARLLGDGIRDTGCGIKVFDREAFLRLPYFDHMHRFLPALMQREGFKVLTCPVNHRPRSAGRSKYSNWGRLWVGIVDLVGVAWLGRRFARREIIAE
ncbi:glycosyltransferase family 2 protein [Ancylobacter terrae]|uniref:glycosyltransferase family 2 protein n=1 Tax=Ancylobacter sp. sgz301288 TaxID=3342077 RepID=UPI00385A83C0